MPSQIDKPTVGFGAPAASDAHRYIVRIPPRTGDVLVFEDYGILDNHAPPTPRAKIARDTWNVIAAPLAVYLNSRLKKVGIRGGKWSPGDNLVERILGAEISALGWACEGTDEAGVRIAFSNWVRLTPPEMHWLQQQVRYEARGLDYEPTGWRRALAVALQHDRGALA